MRVIQFNTTTSGGAAVAARRLHDALVKNGISSQFCYLGPKRNSKPKDASYQNVNSQWKNNRSLRTWLIKRLQKIGLNRALKGRDPGLELFSSPRVYPATLFGDLGLETDIIHLHWIAKLIDYKSFFASIPDDLPVVWTLHDMNPFTGGCHYAGQCTQFEKECSQCPQLGTPGQQDLSWNFFHEKNEAIKNKNIHIVTPSHWLESVARRSAILGNAKSFRTIPYGLDTAVFRPYEKKEARAQLGIRSDKVIVGFGAESLTNYRKGFQHLGQAFTKLSTKHNIAALAFGSGDLRDFDLEVISTGFVSDPHQQALIYSAADLFVMPSLEDNLPQTGIEAMACGTPVVAFDAGGVSDYVKHEETGLLAITGNTADLATQIDWLVTHHKERSMMGKKARAFASDYFDPQKQAAKYVALYQQLLSDMKNLKNQAA
ncbi:MAG: glycosyltransferase family 4 protein [Planctomycetota bacterium]|nr:glycosyltransferase family 4 protein [Planctomycetota bacterium]